MAAPACRNQTAARQARRVADKPIGEPRYHLDASDRTGILQADESFLPHGHTRCQGLADPSESAFRLIYPQRIRTIAFGANESGGLIMTMAD